MIVSTLSAVLALTGAGTFTNPVWNRDFPDPFVVRDGATYYAYATHNSPAGFQLLRSTDLVNWTAMPPVGKPPWSDQQLWAPEVVRWRGKWAFFYSARCPETRKRDLAVAFGDSPAGPFTDDVRLIRGASVNPGRDENGAIDPHIFVENGRPYLLYIREAPPRSLNLVALSSDLRRTVGPTHVLIRADREIERGVLDAPTLVKRDGRYWLFYSSGWFQSWKRDACYQVFVASASRITGPYNKQDTPLLTTRPGETYSPGHQALIQTPTGEWWIAYHAWNAEGDPMYGHNPVGRTLRLDRLSWTRQGPRVAGPTTGAQRLPRLR